MQSIHWLDSSTTREK
jgi:hypothetical protein